MKANKFLLPLALALALFFLSQFIAEVFFLAAARPGASERVGKPEPGPMKLSLSSSIHTQAAYAWLESGLASQDDQAIKASMVLLHQALRRNPLDYQARYYLAKAYLRFSSVNNDYFELGVRELKRAARLRGSNKQIALDCSAVFFSLWPHLGADDRSFALNLLSNVMPALSWPEFSPLVEMWSLYIQDAPVLMELLERKPDFFGLAANQLVAAAIPIDERRELLALHEVHSLDALERRYNELSLQGDLGFEDTRSLLNQTRRLKGYFRLQADSGFNPDDMAKLQRALLLQAISILLGKTKVLPDESAAALAREYVLVYINEHSGLNELDDLQKLLEERNYFKDNDFHSLYLQTLIAFKKGDYSGVISEIEALRQGISFVKKEQQADYTDILLLLVDSYYSTKLLTAAEAVAAELYQEQPDNPDLLWRILRVQKILGSEGNPDKELNSKLAMIENSRFLTVAKPKAEFDVFLFNQPWIEIVFDPALLAALKPKQLVQVFVDDRIAFENYVDALPAKVAIGPKFVKIESKVKVQITVL